MDYVLSCCTLARVIEADNETRTMLIISIGGSVILLCTILGILVSAVIQRETNISHHSDCSVLSEESIMSIAHRRARDHGKACIALATLRKITNEYDTPLTVQQKIRMLHSKLHRDGYFVQD